MNQLTSVYELLNSTVQTKILFFGSFTISYMIVPFGASAQKHEMNMTWKKGNDLLRTNTGATAERSRSF